MRVHVHMHVCARTEPPELSKIHRRLVLRCLHGPAVHRAATGSSTRVACHVALCLRWGSVACEQLRFGMWPLATCATGARSRGEGPLIRTEHSGTSNQGISGLVLDKWAWQAMTTSEWQQVGLSHQLQFLRCATLILCFLAHSNAGEVGAKGTDGRSDGLLNGCIVAGG